MFKQRIPEKLLCIWHGSTPSEQLVGRLSYYKQINRNETVLWYDPDLLTPEQIEETKRLVSKHQSNIKLGNIVEELYPKIPTELHPLLLAAKYETAGPFPNYGARSDIDRWLSLDGLYIDADIKILGLIPTLQNRDGIFFNHHMQASRLKGLSGEPGVIGNDIVAATPNNKIIKAILLELVKSYESPLPETLNDDVTDAFNRTILKSATNFLRRILIKLELAKIDSNKNSNNNFVPQENHEAVLPKEYWLPYSSFDGQHNDLSWMKSKTDKILPRRHYHSQEIFLRDIAIRIIYETSKNAFPRLRQYLRYMPDQLTGYDLTYLKNRVEESYLVSDQKTLLLSQIEEIESNLDEINCQHLHISTLLKIKQFLAVTSWQEAQSSQLRFFSDNTNPFPIEITNVKTLIDQFSQGYERAEISDATTILSTIKQAAQDMLSKPISNNIVTSFLTILTLSAEEINAGLQEENKLKTQLG